MIILVVLFLIMLIFIAAVTFVTSGNEKTKSMTSKAKFIRTIYLYLAALISLIFVAVGTGRLLNTGLKYFFFPDAEKKNYYECNVQPPVASVVSKEGATTEQKVQIDALLSDYQNWKENQSGDNCIKPARQNGIIDALTMIIIALPICLFHWLLIKRDKKEKEEETETKE